MTFCIIMVLVAAVTIFNPMITISFIIRLCSLLILLFGMYKLFNYFFTPQEYRSINSLLVGVLNLLFGVLLILLPQELTMELSAVLISVAIIGWGIIKILAALRLRQGGYRSWIFILTVAIIACVAGLVIFFLPRLSSLLFVYTISAYVAAAGIFGLVELYKLRRFFFSK